LVNDRQSRGNVYKGIVNTKLVCQQDETHRPDACMSQKVLPMKTRTDFERAIKRSNRAQWCDARRSRMVCEI
jgi:hypothetical protein